MLISNLLETGKVLKKVELEMQERRSMQKASKKKAISLSLTKEGGRLNL
jgi:hypothetical protein